MTTLTIALDEQQLHHLQDAARVLGVEVEELVRMSIDEYCARRQLVQQATEYVLAKNAELYRRLAR